MNYKATVNKYSANVRACEHCEALTPSFQKKEGLLQRVSFLVSGIYGDHGRSQLLRIKMEIKLMQSVIGSLRIL